MSDSLLVAARAWYDAGFAVIPSHEDGSKRPFGPWKSFQSERPTWAQVEEWLGSGRFTGIGVLTGAASGNAELIEIEGPMQLAVERLNAVADLARGMAQIGVPDLLTSVASGCVEQSAGGGLHLFIRVTDGPAKGNTKLAFTGQGAERKVISETRGEGGFVIVAPTPGRNGHPEGAAYLFVNGGHPAKTVEVTSEERDVLHHLFTLALHEHEDTPAAEDTPRAAGQHQGLSAFDDYRERTLWRDILTPAGWRQGPTMADGRTHWTRPGGQGFEGTSATTIEDGPLFCFSTNAGLPTEQGLSKGQVYAHLHHGGDMSAAARTLAAEGFGEQSSGHEIPAWEAQLDPDATEEEKAEAARSWVLERLPLLNWHDLWADQTEEEWLVEPILAKRRLVALYSAPKVGKSLLMLEIAASIAAGRPVLGNDSAPAKGIRTLYVDFENDPRADVRERLRDMGFGPDDLADLCYLSFPTIAKLDTKAGGDELMAAVAEYGCQVVVIDTVSRSVAGDENENDTWLNFYRHTGLRLKQAEVALIRLDHAGKDETKGQRGGSAKSGDVDAVWRLTKTGEGLFRLICEANRFPVTEKVVDLERVEGGRLHHKRDMQAHRKVVDEITPKYAQAGIPRDGSATVRGTLKALRDAGIQFTKGQVTKATLAEYCRQMPSFETPGMVP